MTNKMIMLNAWKAAKIGAKRHGGKASQYIAEALKMVWRSYKETKAKKGGVIAAISTPFLQKKFNHPSVVDQIQQSVYKVLKQTDKAYYIEAVAHEGGIVISNKFWAPKAVCA